MWSCSASIQCGLQTWKKFKMQTHTPDSLNLNPCFNNIPPRGFLSLSKDTVASVTLPHDLALLWLHRLSDTHSFSVSTSVPLHLLCLLPDTNFQCVSTWLKCPNSFRILLNYQWASPDIKSQYCPKNLHSPRIPVLSALLLLQSPFQLSGILCLCLLICLLFLFCSTL